MSGAEQRCAFVSLLAEVDTLRHFDAPAASSAFDQDEPWVGWDWSEHEVKTRHYRGRWCHASTGIWSCVIALVTVLCFVMVCDVWLFVLDCICVWLFVTNITSAFIDWSLINAETWHPHTDSIESWTNTFTSQKGVWTGWCNLSIFD